jgi:hypothetical protein
VEVQDLLHEISERTATRQWHTSGWDIFDVLGCVRFEDAHSDMLAWFFQPREAHGLGDRFIREFGRASESGPLPSGKAREVETRKEIGPDGRRIDIEVQGDGCVLAVEDTTANIVLRPPADWNLS